MKPRYGKKHREEDRACRARDDPLCGKPFVLLTRSATRAVNGAEGDRLQEAGYRLDALRLSETVPKQVDTPIRKVDEAFCQPRQDSTDDDETTSRSVPSETCDYVGWRRRKVKKKLRLPPNALPAVPLRRMRAAIPLITECMEWSEQLTEFLDSRNGNFITVGVLGPQGVGKSTFLSMLGGNASSDMYRQYKFRPESKECAESGWYQTSGIQVFISAHRLILLDSQPLLGAAVMRNLTHYSRRAGQKGAGTPDLLAQESMKVAAFMLQVCHVVFMLVDHFIDQDLIRFLLSSDALKPAAKAYDNFPEHNRLPHIVWVQHKARCEDFQVHTYLRKSAVLAKLLQDTPLNCFKYFGMPKTFTTFSRQADSQVNLIILPSIKPRGYDRRLYNGFRTAMEYDDLVADLQRQIANVRRLCVVTNVFVDEFSWYTYAMKIWEATRRFKAISAFAKFYYG